MFYEKELIFISKNCKWVKYKKVHFYKNKIVGHLMTVQFIEQEINKAIKPIVQETFCDQQLKIQKNPLFLFVTHINWDVKKENQFKKKILQMPFDKLLEINSLETRVYKLDVKSGFCSDFYK